MYPKYPPECPTRDNEQRLAVIFLLHGITHVSVDFDGSGDSGSIQNVDFYKGGDIDEKIEKVKMLAWAPPRNVFDPASNQWTSPPSAEAEVTVREALENVVYEDLENSDVDWYNNDGGFGTWEWSSSEGINFEVYQRTVHEELAHQATRKLGKDGEQE